MGDKKPLKVAIYARFSSDLQKDRSITDQFADLEKAAERFGFKLDKRHYFSDRAVSGSSLFERPGLTRDLLGAAERREFDVILVEATDRLSRSRADLFWLADRFQFFDVRIFTAAGEVSDIQLTFDSHTNADFVKKLSARVKRGHDGVAREGKIPSPLAYGYDKVPNKPGERAINEAEADVIRRIFREYAVGRTPRQIVAGLAEDGVPSPSGAQFWNHQVIVGGLNKRGLIHNRLYVGEYVKNRTYQLKNPATGKRVSRKADPSNLIVVQVPHLRIVDQTLWVAAHAVREQRGEKLIAAGVIKRPTNARREHLLSGVLRCDCCGGHMTIMASNVRGRGPRVACSNALYRKTCSHSKSYWLDNLIKGAIDGLNATLSDPEFIKTRAKVKAEEMARLSKQEDHERRSAQKRLDDLNLKIKRLADTAAQVGPVPEVIADITKLSAEREATKEKMRLLGAESNVAQLIPANLAAISKAVDLLREKLRANELDLEARLAFANLMESVVVKQTAKGEPYKIVLNARLSAFTEGIDLFPAAKSATEIIDKESIFRTSSGGTKL